MTLLMEKLVNAPFHNGRVGEWQMFRNVFATFISLIFRYFLTITVNTDNVLELDIQDSLQEFNVSYCSSILSSWRLL